MQRAPRAALSFAIRPAGPVDVAFILTLSQRLDDGGFRQQRMLVIATLVFG